MRLKVYEWPAVTCTANAKALQQQCTQCRLMYWQQIYRSAEEYKTIEPDKPIKKINIKHKQGANDVGQCVNDAVQAQGAQACPQPATPLNSQDTSP